MSVVSNIKKVLIANRGEIACRIIASARQQHIRSVAVFSEADQHAMHVQLADEAIAIGAPPASQSYLVQDKIIAAAKQCGADAIHPGYGFLSENAGFANRCEAEGIIFIGPPASAIEAMGSKSRAKQIMEHAGVPLVPGYHGDEQNSDFLLAEARRIGFPVMLKAAAGGGGKGMRQVMTEADFHTALDAAKREAKASFDDELMLVEKFLTQPRHVEIQVFCDQHGNGVYLFDRDCSVQRRHQKIIEEAPAPNIADTIRQQMGESALAAAKAIDYVGAGTVEFLLDGDDFYFMEMNTRLQVEHPVTEMVSGEDLVAWQLAVAAGQPLPKTQQQLRLTGHAFEVRLYAEDPDNEFLPSTGRLKRLRFPPKTAGVRVDTGFTEGDTVSVHYDPMLAKLITHSDSRNSALAKMLNCLEQTRVTGVTTNLPYVYRVLKNEDFAAARLTVHFIHEHQATLALQAFNIDYLPAMACCLYQALQIGQAPLNDTELSGFRLNHQRQHYLTVQCGQKHYLLTVTATSNGLNVNHEDHHWLVNGRIEDEALTITLDGYQRRYTVCPDNHGGWVLFDGALAVPFVQQRPDFGQHEDDHGNDCVAPMNGTVVKLLVEPGMKVSKGTSLLILEAMKMEHNVKAPADGQVATFYYQAGDLVDGGSALLEFNADE